MRGRSWVGSIVVWVWAAGAAAAPPGAAPRATPGVAALDKPAFTATPGELLALGAAAPAGDESQVVLREQRDVSYDASGRATSRARRVYVVRTLEHDEDDLDGEDTIHAAWHPSYQNKPVIRVRVIGPDGATAELDPAQITEPPRAQRADHAVGDHRYLAARLPALQVGAVVEQEIAIIDREPLLGGSVEITPIRDPVPPSGMVISYSAPAAIRIHQVSRKLPASARVRHQVVDGRETWTYTVAAPPERIDHEADVPADVVTAPYVGVSTAASWEAAARAYRKQIDQQIAARPFDLPGELPRTSTIETLAAVVAWVHHHVRYTSNDLGDPIRAPLPPADTVKQAAGDSSDQATLLVALLRQAQIDAEIALVASASWARRFDPELPGIGGFDRAIVRARIGAREIWIDPAEELQRPGQLPERDQGQRVLVIAPDTRGLSTTPAAAAADNTIREVRTFTAAEHGPSQLTRVVRGTGVFEAELRNQLRGAHADLFRKQLGQRSDTLFGGTLDRVTSTDAEDLSRPFEVTTTVKDARRVYTEVEQIDIYLYPHTTFEHLPWIVTAKLDKPRHNEFSWSRPQVYELENRIVVPPGFAPPVAAPERVRRIGTVTFTEHQQVDGNTLVVTFRLDTGKPRLTAAELATLQAGLDELRQESVHLKIEYTAFALGYAGKPREAIAEAERLVALHPAESLHRSQLAMVLLRAGAGDAARREARKAVAMAPADAGAQVVLGWVLGFDTLGRPYTYNWDRPGAIAALRQARKLSPKHLGAAVMLAQALLRGPSGRAYEDADLAGATEAWRAALAIDKTDEHALALAEVLVWSGEFAEAEKVARTAGAGAERDKLLVAAIAGGRGARPAIQEATQLSSGDARNQLVTSAAWAVLVMRRYDLARELLTESGALSQLPPAAATLVTQVTNHADGKPSASDPRAAVFDVLAAAVDPRRKTAAFWDAEVEREVRSEAWPLVPAAMRGPVALRWLVDAIQSRTTVEVVGEAGLWRATVTLDRKPDALYLVLDRGVVKLIGNVDQLSGVGRYILRSARDAGAEPRARKLLDWVRADVDKSNKPGVLWFKRLWGPGLPSSHDALLLAAAMLAGPSDPDRVIAIASRCASTLPDAELACHEALIDAYATRERWAEAVAQDEAIVALRPGSFASHTRFRASALARAGRLDDAEHVLDQVLATDPDDHEALLGRVDLAAIRGARAELIRTGDALVNHATVVASDFNEVAWCRLGLGGDLSGALDLARKAVDRAPDKPGIMNTLAAIEAEVGDVDLAIHHGWKAMELGGAIEPGAGDWYVAGRIDEQLGLTGDAIAAYQRVARPGKVVLFSPYELAQRRLAVIAGKQ